VKQVAFWDRQGVVTTCLLLLSMIMLSLGVNHWRAAQRAFGSAVEDLELCQRLTQDIVALRDRPRVASLEIESPQQTIDRISAAQSLSQISSDSLVSVAPALPTRFGNTAYQTRNTELTLQHITMAQLHQFASAMHDNNQGLVVGEMNITPDPAGRMDASNTMEWWNARLVLTQLIYSPTSTAAQ
jgi:hypothetical protein